MLTANTIRQQFIDFFVQKHNHTFVPSSGVVPFDDPTLLFSNAGMNQFKDVFLGTGTRPYTRAVNTQKCIRAGGKHNDLDDVGRDTYHHTFFEMLGNWSFGDYFKREAIAWAWQLLTDVWQIDRSRLHVTVFGGDPKEGLERDDEAANLWRDVAGVPETHIHSGSKKDNFWEMGSTGPCGPCTEIHIDRTPDKSGGKLVNAGVPEVMEIWNLVFIQYNRDDQGQLALLPAKHVDTGMGFERVTAVLQGKDSNYDTDVFTPLFAAIQKLTKADPYGGSLSSHQDTAYRVIADHLRTLTFALTDGAELGNDGRNYVLKRILRRAARYGRQYLGTKHPFLHELVGTVVEHFGPAFPELKRKPQALADVIHAEEQQFIRTLDRGIKLFADAAKRAQELTPPRISGEDAFKLYDTYGIYIDITQQMAQETGLNVDVAEYDVIVKRAQEDSRGNRKVLNISAIQGELPATDDAPKYHELFCDASVAGWVDNNVVTRVGELATGSEVALLLSRTNFYAEQGGQVGDVGTIRTSSGAFRVEDTKRLGDAVLHLGQVISGTLSVGQAAQLTVDSKRIDIMRNHTTTHLLNLALRQVLGEHVEQKGSLVDAEKTRFDFAHATALSTDELHEVERIVNEKIMLNLAVSAQTLPLAQAKQINGVRAVFGEKYPDPVRVVLIGTTAPTATPDHSVEFCGGTHLARTGSAGFCKIVSQEGVAKGVRRITAVTGSAAIAAVQKQEQVLTDLLNRFHCKPDEIAGRVAALADELKSAQHTLKKGAANDLASSADQLFAAAETVGTGQIVCGTIPTSPDDAARTQADRIKQKLSSGVVIFGWVADDKPNLLVAVTKDLIDQGLKAGDLAKQAAAVMGGTGGGPPTMARAAGKDASQLPAALAKAKELAAARLV
jgi:alanyl-tRNA synthetase